MSELKSCPMRAENGNCSPVGGFCTSVPELYCEAANRAYQTGYHDGATEAMRRAQPANEPLTLEQLREMNGEPVWVSDIKEWAIVAVDANGHWAGMPFVMGRGFNYDVKMRELTCYRRPPERSENG